MKVTRFITTKMFADGDAVATELTINFTGLSNEDILEIATRAAVVSWQSNARRMKIIPKVAEYMVPKPGTRSSGVLTPEALVQRYGSVDNAINALKELMK